MNGSLIWDEICIPQEHLNFEIFWFQHYIWPSWSTCNIISRIVLIQHFTLNCNYQHLYNLILCLKLFALSSLLSWWLRYVWSQWIPQFIQKATLSQSGTCGGMFVTTVRCRYNTVNFLPNPHNRHPINRPWGRHMGYLLWFLYLIHLLSLLL